MFNVANVNPCLTLTLFQSQLFSSQLGSTIKIIGRRPPEDSPTEPSSNIEGQFISCQSRFTRIQNRSRNDKISQQRDGVYTLVSGNF